LSEIDADRRGIWRLLLLDNVDETGSASSILVPTGLAGAKTIFFITVGQVFSESARTGLGGRMGEEIAVVGLL
jgi:hypothetical protein